MSTTPTREELFERYQRRLQLLTPVDASVLRLVPLFSGVPEKSRDVVIEKVRPYVHLLEAAAGELILREGDYGDSAYYVATGSVEVQLPAAVERRTRPRVRGGAHAVRGRPRGSRDAQGMLGRPTGDRRAGGATEGERIALDAGEIFGELSALSHYPVSANVRARVPTRLLRIRLPGLRMLRAASRSFREFLDQRYRDRSLSVALRGVPLFQWLDAAGIEQLRRSAQLLTLEPGDAIAHEGDPADAFYLVRGGYLKVSVLSGASELPVSYLRKGEYAGEAGLLLDLVWPFTLRALEHAELVKLDHGAMAEALKDKPGLQESLWQEMMARLKTRGGVLHNPTSARYLQMAMDTGLIHGESVLMIDLNTCTRCDDCVRGCADAHGGQSLFVREGGKYRNWLIPTACYQCSDPVCMLDCPTGAITRDIGTLEVTIDAPTCIGCTNCATRCPWGNILMVDEGEQRADGKPVETAAKCDLCLMRPEGPACVQMCPHDSAIRISFKEVERLTGVFR